MKLSMVTVLISILIFMLIFIAIICGIVILVKYLIKYYLESKRARTKKQEELAKMSRQFSRNRVHPVSLKYTIFFSMSSLVISNASARQSRQ